LETSERRPCPSIPYAYSGRDGRQHERRTGKRRQVDEDDLAGNQRGETAHRLQGEAGLADAGWSGQRQQPGAWVRERTHDRGQLGGATNKRVLPRGKGERPSNIQRHEAGPRLAPRRRQEQRLLVFRQLQPRDEALDRLTLRDGACAAFEVTDAAHTHAAAFSQQLLGQAMRHAQAAQHLTEVGMRRP
jgi:hypothetical protein